MKRSTLVFALLCLVSLFADVTYEGARSVIGPYLEMLGASAMVAGLAVLGDALGYCARLLSGVATFRAASSRSLWRTTLLGYAVNLFSVPPLAFAQSWWQVLSLVFAERIGKGLRTPTRDTILAELVRGLGRGKGFGIHEVADQVGAISGPLLVALLYAVTGLRSSFLLLAIPATISITLVIAAWRLYPRVESFERRAREGLERFSTVSLTLFGKRFAKLLLATFLLGLGFMPWVVVSYAETSLGFSPEIVALSYAIAMGVDAAVALPMGWLYDRAGARVMVVAPAACTIIPLALETKSVAGLFTVAAAWGIAMGTMESVFRASVADLVDPRLRPLAYGVAYFVFGMSWLACGLYTGFLLQCSPSSIPIAITIFSILSALLYASIGASR